jgi:hypothetical protein
MEKLIRNIDSSPFLANLPIHAEHGLVGGLRNYEAVLARHRKCGSVDRPLSSHHPLVLGALKASATDSSLYIGRLYLWRDTNDVAGCFHTDQNGLLLFLTASEDAGSFVERTGAKALSTS